jgi:hypothetical protein
MSKIAPVAPIAPWSPAIAPWVFETLTNRPFETIDPNIIVEIMQSFYNRAVVTKATAAFATALATALAPASIPSVESAYSFEESEEYSIKDYEEDMMNEYIDYMLDKDYDY